VKVAASWAKRGRVSAAALREVGVPGRVLAKGRRVSDESKGDHRHQAPHQGLRRLVLTNCDSYEHTYPPGSHRGHAIYIAS
jgi:hypothetical protein